MRYLVISDIHANLDAFEAVLAHAEDRWDRVLVLGDLVGYGAQPGAVIDRVRSLDAEVNNSLPERLERVVAGICQATRARYTFEFVRGYPAMVNDETFTQHAIDSVKAILGEKAIAHLPTPQLGGEDFAFFAQRVPSLMFRLGVRNESRGIVHGVHSSRFDLDEDALPIGATALAGVAKDYVQKAK